MEICESCLDKIVNRLSMEDISILNVLIKEKSISDILSIDKNKILRESVKLTDYKFQIAIARLEISGLVGRNIFKRPNQFYITDEGVYVIKKYKEVTMDKLKNLE